MAPEQLELCLVQKLVVLKSLSSIKCLVSNSREIY